MAVCITNQSKERTHSSVASLVRAACSGSFLVNVSREKEFNNCFEENLKCELDFFRPRHEGDFESALNRLTDFFRFMPDDGGGIMSHINSLMEQEHGRLVHDWMHVDGHTYQMEQLVRNVQRFRFLCKDFQIQDREYDCLTSNFLVEKPRGLTMRGVPFFMTARMMQKLRICQVTYTVIELMDKYEALENFLLNGGGDFDDTFQLGSTVVKVASIKDPSKAVSIKAESKTWGYFTREVSYKTQINLNFSTILQEVTDFARCNTNIDEIKLVGRVLSCLKHMSNYRDYEAQFGVIDNLYNVGCDNFIVAKSPTIHEILRMKPPNDLVLVDLSQVSDVPLIFGTDISTIHEIRSL